MSLGSGKVFVLLVLLCSSITVFSDSVSVANLPPPVQPPAVAPAPHHRGHHRHPPVKPPTHPPVKPPSHPPVKPPATSPPVKPPTPPPVKPPTPPPVKPPTHPPVKPPTPPPAKPPSHPPVKPPSPPPTKPPSPPPSPPPSYPPTRKAVAVQGVVYCKSCKYRGIDTLLKATPLSGAVVKLQCNNTKWGLVEQTKTDKNGYFFFKPPKLTTAAFHKCKVFLLSSPLVTCSIPTNLGGGLGGAPLVRSLKPPAKPLPFELFTVGPFAFEPSKKVPCHV